MNNPDNDADRKRSLFENLMAGIQQQAERKNELAEELKLAMAPYKETERKLSNAKRTKKDMVAKVLEAKQKLKAACDEIAANAESAESDEARFTALLRDAEEELAVVRANVDPLKQAQAEWLRSYEELEPHVREAKSKADEVKGKRQRVQNTLGSLQASSGNDSLTLLGPRVAALAKAVSMLSRRLPRWTRPVLTLFPLSFLVYSGRRGQTGESLPRRSRGSYRQLYQDSQWQE